jgi:thiopurine S-methyltransferase
MEPEFWHERWQQNQIGFHLSEVNPQLLRHHAALGPADAHSRVLVPLCGKTLDLAWLAQAGHDVVGVELSSMAVEAFFAEQQLAPQRDTHGPFARYRVPGIELLCGDVFTLDRSLLGPVTALYDRAALVAFPPAMRQRYVQHVSSLLPTGARGLLVTFDYEPADLQGPPFSVDDALVHTLYEPNFELRLLERLDVLDREPRFKARGIHTLHESAHALVRR